MVQKPKIEYVSQLYIHGSAAPKIQQPTPSRKRKSGFVPQPKPQIRQISVDPVALVGLVVAVIMVAALILGAVQISSTWEEYDAIEGYLAQLKKENALLEHNYRSGYDLAAIEASALAQGMVPASEVKTIILNVELPTPEPEPTLWEDIVWFLKGLFEDAPV